jgi:Mrp family chromosome partitioning ATPase
MAENNEDFKAEMNAFSNISHVIGVVSGKGGVGKSMVAASLANAMAAQGFRVGILDADITGPSIPKMYGLHDRAQGDDNGIYPPLTKNGIEVMSTNLILEGEEEPVIWRGPVIGGVVKQFWTDVIWGQLDYLVIDMPPGTGDVPLTVYQSLPIEGIVIVTSPQDLVKMIVTKAYKMAQMMEVPVLGIVENYSYLVCPDCGRKINVFGESHIDEIAKSLNLPVLGKIPMTEEYSHAADEGTFSEVLNTYIDGAVEALRKLDEG